MALAPSVAPNKKRNAGSTRRRIEEKSKHIHACRGAQVHLEVIALIMWVLSKRTLLAITSCDI